MNVEQISLMRIGQVEEACGCKKSFIYKEMKDGSFPKAVRLGSKSVAWRSDEIQQWINDRERVTQLVSDQGQLENQSVDKSAPNTNDDDSATNTRDIPLSQEHKLVEGN